MSHAPIAVPNGYRVILPVTLTNDLLSNAMTNAAEGGSNYWARISVPASEASSLDYQRIRVREFEGHAEYTPLDRIVTLADIALGVQRLAEHVNDPKFPAAAQHLNDFLTEQDDATTADVILQLALFNEVIYG